MENSENLALLFPKGEEDRREEPARLHDREIGDRGEGQGLSDGAIAPGVPVYPEPGGGRDSGGDQQDVPPGASQDTGREADQGSVCGGSVKSYGTVKLRGSKGKTPRWSIRCDPHARIKLKQLFRKVSKGEFNEIRITATMENSVDLDWFMMRFPMVMSEEDSLHLSIQVGRHKKQATLSNLILTGEYKHPEYAMRLPPRDYQAIAAALVYNNRSLLLADELGLGKTIVGLTLLSHPETLPALVVCPTHMPSQWMRETLRFLPGLKIFIPKKGTAHEFGKPDVIIMNYHKLRGWADLVAGYVKSVIYDEVQELRRMESAKYDAAVHVSESCDWKLGLSATPIYNYGGEFFNVINAMSPGRLGSKAEFLREWASGYYEERTARISDPKAFGSYLRDTGIMLRRTKKDVGRELPGLQRIPQTVEANPDALKEIESAATELASFILNREGAKGFEVMQSSQELSKILRQATGIAKAPFVAEFVKMLVESSGGKVLLFGWHRAVYDIWAERLKDLQPAWYTGTESTKKKDEEKSRFIKDPKCKVIMMSLRSGAGIDGLQDVCSRVAFGELDWSPGAIDQCEGRIYRDGQKEPVFSYFLNANVGCDPTMMDVLGIKRGQMEGVRDVDADLVKKSQIDPDHVKKLAETYLKGKI